MPYRENLRSLKFLANLDIPNQYMFYSANLESINIIGNTKIIGVMAFDGCHKLNTLLMSDTVEKLEFACFRRCRLLKNIKLSANLKVIESSAFSSCTGIENLKLPDGLISIGTNAFSNCYFKELYIPSSVTSDPNKFLNNAHATVLYIPRSMYNRLKVDKFTYITNKIVY